MAGIFAKQERSEADLDIQKAERRKSAVLSDSGLACKHTPVMTNNNKINRLLMLTNSKSPLTPLYKRGGRVFVKFNTIGI